MYLHDSCPAPARMLQESTSAALEVASEVLMQSPGAATELAFRAWRSLPRRREAPGLLSVSVSSFQAFRLL